jgi:hypothetical protein
MLRLCEADLEAIRAHGATTFPNECCGVLLGDVEGADKTVREVRPLANVFEPNEDFENSVLPAGAQAGETATVGQERRCWVFITPTPIIPPDRARMTENGPLRGIPISLFRCWTVDRPI